MVKIQDGSLVPASELITGGGQDDEGKPLKFELVKDAAMPQYRAVSKMDDGSGRTRTYSFGFDDTNVVVHMTVVEDNKEAEEKAPKTEKVTKEVTPSPSSSATDTKKNSSPASISDHQKKYL